MKNISVMIKPVSSLCNLRCKYCFYEDVSNSRENHSYGIMKEETTNNMLNNIKNEIEENGYITLAFQGGEPTLAGIEYFENIIKEVNNWDKQVTVTYSLQTNGINLDEKWASFLKEHDFLVGISFDILKEQHDEARKCFNNEGTYQKVLKSIKIMEKKAVRFNILCTLTNEIARYPKKVWNQIKKLNLNYIQFTPCLDSLEIANKNIYTLTSQRFASFYIEIFRFWLNGFKNGEYISIKLFDDLVNLLLSGVPTACGITGKCQAHLIVESNGNVYPCDFYCLDEFLLGDIGELSVKDLHTKSYLSKSKERDKLPKLCGHCRYFEICGGNCKRMQKEICFDRNDTYCGYKGFLDFSINDLVRIANEEKQYYLKV